MTALSAAAQCAGQPPPIQPAPTSVALFVGIVAKGSPTQPVHVRSWVESRRAFGKGPNGSELDRAVSLYFLNGGREAWVVGVEADRGASVADTVGSALETVEDYDLVCLPGIDDADALRAAVEQCERRRAILLVDLPAECDTAGEAKRWLSAHRELRHPNVAAYLPWIETARAERSMGPAPPSGAVAGVIARTDQAVGVWKAPAGPDAELRGVTGLTGAPNQVETDALAQLGVNSLRVLSDGRVVVWGARTLADDPEWRYLPVRRLFLFLEESISTGTEWAVFEPNDEPLWQMLRMTVTAFMDDLFRQGAFQGTTPAEAYFVKCGTGTTDVADLEQGVCNVVVGFAPVKPAEFAIVRIQQKTAQAQ